MKERVATLLRAQGAREPVERIAISTFHALGSRSCVPTPRPWA